MGEATKNMVFVFHKASYNLNLTKLSLWMAFFFKGGAGHDAESGAT